MAENNQNGDYGQENTEAANDGGWPSGAAW